ncbi:MAG: ATP-dependent DNA helicase RecG [Hespellia sp.]|nr:ATP-dependent DNA helicase RecG [Hespellia sp.]
MDEYSSIRELKGIGEKSEKLFAKIGVRTVGDLVYYFPREYDVYERAVSVGELEENRIQTVTGVLYGAVQVGGNAAMQITTACIKDVTGTLHVVWYRMPFLRNTLRAGDEITLRGKVTQKRGRLMMEHPEIFYPAKQYEKKLDTLQPIYPLTANLTNNLIVKVMHQVFAQFSLRQEMIPEKIRMQFHLCEINFALRGIHFPKNREDFYIARRRLVFEEFLIFILALRSLKESESREKNKYRFQHQEELDSFLQKLPYCLTNAQQRVLRDIETDFSGETVMSRLIQGDVGSGKTIVALWALFDVCLNGYQAAMMAPTEVLARQHFESIVHMAEEYELPVRTVLLTGSMKAKEKRMAYEQIESREVDLVVGTHALIQEKVNYRNLALVVTDEQHRFGVRQRETFAAKGSSPHILVMSATPIPRTLALILYGDLDISVIDELPSNRKAIKNCVVGTGYRQSAYRFMRQQIAEGRQCYVICPMVEESENLEAENVMDYSAMLQKEMGAEIRVACLHGKMKALQKEQIMMDFGAHRIDILVSTTVIEVGIDVPNATVMLIENAERFGLAQLHQLRGRVGRGRHQSYCIFMSPSKAKETKERLTILEKSNDGFHIAEEDLRLRGPGDVFGIRQSGLMDFRIGDVFQDANILKEANAAVTEILKQDSELSGEEHQLLKQKMQSYIRNASLEQTL